jgi:alcohol dehydrogenase
MFIGCRQTCLSVNAVDRFSSSLLGFVVSTFRSVHVAEPGATLKLVDREPTAPGPGQVRVTVEACGVCHTDSEFVDGHPPGLTFPVTPGHEVAGRIDAIGEGVLRWQPGDRVTVGWSGGYCGYCTPCRRGDFAHCEEGWVTGAACAGGYAESIMVPATAIARIPVALSAADAAPMACAGLTMFNSLRRSGARSGDLVAILGLGGLGHLGVQFAAKMGYRVAVIARGQEKAALAFELGAHHYIDSTATDVAAELSKLGGARVVQATAANADAISATIDGLAPHGELLALAVLTDSLTVSPLQLIMASKNIDGHPGGTAMYVEETLNLAALHGIRPMVEEVPLDDAADAYARMATTRPGSAWFSPPAADAPTGRARPDSPPRRARPALTPPDAARCREDRSRPRQPPLGHHRCTSPRWCQRRPRPGPSAVLNCAHRPPPPTLI